MPLLNQRRWSLLLVLALLLSVFWAGRVGAQPADDVVAGEILVKFKAGTPSADVAAVHRQNGGQVKRTVDGIDVQVVQVPSGAEAAKVLAYAGDDRVEFAEPNGRYYAVGAPNDPLYAQQWQYNNAGGTTGKADADIDAPEAWNVTMGDPSVTVAMLDTGISSTHPDLPHNQMVTKDFTGKGSVEDGHGHGTHTAGSVAALTNNRTGVAGTCPNCTLFIGKVLADNGGGDYDWIASGITWAADNGAKVISMSLGGDYDSPTVRSAVDYAWQKGSVIVAAAGNNGSNLPFYPAYYTNVVAVAATTNTDTKASFSNFGTWVDIAAPGDGILSTTVDGGYAAYSGTSMATPHVAGVAGLVFSREPTLTNADVRARIQTTADPIKGTGTYWSNGRLNAYNAVTNTVPSRAKPGRVK